MTKSTFQHLRFPFSALLAPVFFFAVSQSVSETGASNWIAILTSFLVLHFLIYPASNGYNSFYDRDEEAIGGLERPPPVANDLLYWSWGLEILGLIMATLLMWQFALMLLVYGVFSKLYSHPRVRLKARPVLSWMVVVFFQGAWVYFATALLIDPSFTFQRHIFPAVVSSLLLAGAYPLTQVFQHREDERRGDKTLSRLLGVKGTFLFSACCFSVAGLSLISYFLHRDLMHLVFAASVLLAPATGFFCYWFVRVGRDPSQASFKNTMRMSMLWATGSILLFIFAWSKPAAALEAQLFSLQGASDEVVFRFYSNDISQDGKIVRETRFENTSGEVVAREKVTFQGWVASDYELDHAQQKLVVKIRKAGERFQAEIRKDGKVRTDSASASAETILPPMILDRIQSDLEKLKKGERLKFKVLIPDLMQTITFEAKMEKGESTSSTAPLVIRLNPSNWLISLLAPPPLYFHFDSSSKVPLEARGQTLLLDKNAKPFFARTVFKN